MLTWTQLLDSEGRGNTHVHSKTHNKRQTHTRTHAYTRTHTLVCLDREAVTAIEKIVDHEVENDASEQWVMLR